MTRRSASSRFAWLAMAVAIVSTSYPVSSQTVGPPAPTTRVPTRDCEGDPTSRTEVVVCGRRRGESPFRLAPQFRNQQEPEGTSWSSAARDMREAQRFEEQTVGLGGASQRSRETDCRWRAERQQIRGEQVDCTRSVRPAIAD